MCPKYGDPRHYAFMTEITCCNFNGLCAKIFKIENRFFEFHNKFLSSLFQGEVLRLRLFI